MLKSLCRAVNNSCTYNIKKRLHSTSTLTEKWDLVTAICLERKPIIAPPLTAFEEKFQKLIRQLEFERSLKSDHELKHEKDLKQKELLKQGGDVDIEVSLKETAQDFVDACNEELTKFKFGSKTTEADKSNDLKSLNRKLDRHLVLLVKQKLGQDDVFLLPQGLRQSGETLRQSAERVLKDVCGSEIKAQFYGNAPVGFYKYKYPKNVQEKMQTTGSKVFFYIAKYCSGELPKTELDYKWLDRTELSKLLNPKYHNSLAQFLIDED